MSDFLFTRNLRQSAKLVRAIQAIYLADAPEIVAYQGAWGSLAVSKGHYRGFDTVETDRHVMGVAGGPVLYFRDNHFLSGGPSSEATQAIYQRWLAGDMNWENDLSGPFAVILIDKQTAEIQYVTDLMGFIPVYEAVGNEGLVFGTHVDAVAAVAGQAGHYDPVSITDFILHNVVTYPHTVYQGVLQGAPATVTTHGAGGRREYNYWLPEETLGFPSLNTAAQDLRQGMEEYVGRVTESMDEVAQFISGGEDSRALSGMLPGRLKRDAYIFLDQMNREGKLAAQVADVYGASFHPQYRTVEHYLTILPEAATLIGAGHQYTHAHSLGFHRSCDLQRYPAVFGGYLADSLLKGCFARKLRGTVRFPFLPEFGLDGETRTQTVVHDAVPESVLVEITGRRRQHYQAVARFRPITAHEWFVLWPATMRFAIPNFFSTRRLFRSYEPFMSHCVVKTAAAVPTSWKLNRRLFNRTAKPWLKPSKFNFHADGRLPYFPFWVNNPLQFGVWAYRDIAERIGPVKGNQGPWADWLATMRTPEWQAAEERYIRQGLFGLDAQFKGFERLLECKSEESNISPYLNMMQVGFGVMGRGERAGDAAPRWRK